MAERRALFVEVDEDRADDLIKALSQRSYINIVSCTIEEKRKRKVCPCCNRAFPREVRYSFTGEILEALLAILYTMKIAKSVVVVNKHNPAEKLPPAELERTVQVDQRILEKAIVLGAVKKFVDGSRDTYFVTAKAISFLYGDEPFEPAELVYYNDACVEAKGKVLVGEVKFKDLIRQEIYLREVKKAIRNLSTSTMNFVKSGQLSLADL